MQSFRRERRASERTSERARVAITGGILGTPGLMPNNPHAADTSCLCTKTTPLSLGPTPSPDGGRRCRLKFQPDAAPKKRLPLSRSLCLSPELSVSSLSFSLLFFLFACLCALCLYLVTPDTSPLSIASYYYSPSSPINRRLNGL